MTFSFPLSVLIVIGLSVLVLNGHANLVEKPYLESEETWRRGNLVDVAWPQTFCSKPYAGSASSRYEYLCISQATIRAKRFRETVRNDIDRYSRPKSDATITSVRGDTVIPVDSPAGNTNITRQSYSVEQNSSNLHEEKKDEEVIPPDNHRKSDHNSFSFVVAPVIVGIAPISAVVAIALCILCKRKTLQQGVPLMTDHQPILSSGTPTGSQGEIVPPVCSSQPIGHFSISGHQVVGEPYLWCGRIHIPFVTDHSISQFSFPPNCLAGMEERVHSYEVRSQQDADRYGTWRPAPGSFTDSESTSTAHSSIESLRTE